MDASMRKFFGWMSKFADEQRPMDLDEFFTFVTFDISGEVVFSKPFRLLDGDKDVNHSIAMNLAMEAYIAFVGYLQWLHRLFANPLVTRLGVLPMGHLFDTTMAVLAERRPGRPLVLRPREGRAGRLPAVRPSLPPELRHGQLRGRARNRLGRPAELRVPSPPPPDGMAAHRRRDREGSEAREVPGRYRLV